MMVKPVTHFLCPCVLLQITYHSYTEDTLMRNVIKILYDFNILPL
jgi:hypothetical protein